MGNTRAASISTKKTTYTAGREKKPLGWRIPHQIISSGSR